MVGWVDWPPHRDVGVGTALVRSQQRPVTALLGLSAECRQSDTATVPSAGRGLEGRTIGLMGCELCF